MFINVEFQFHFNVFIYLTTGNLHCLQAAQVKHWSGSYSYSFILKCVTLCTCVKGMRLLFNVA